jgi:hypothetical protein
VGDGGSIGAWRLSDQALCQWQGSAGIPKTTGGWGNVNEQDVKWGTDGQLLSEGTISLQSESHPVEFRKIEILNLEGCMDPKALNYRSYYVKNISNSCKYKK